jgi:hypothetical protein
MPTTTSLADRFASAADLLEEIVANRAIILDIPEDLRNRLIGLTGVDR